MNTRFLENRKALGHRAFLDNRKALQLGAILENLCKKRLFPKAKYATVASSFSKESPLLA